MRYIFIVACVLLGGCESHRPSDGPRDGEIVYLRANCEKVVVIDWAPITGHYVIEDQKGAKDIREPGELALAPSGCIQWSNP